MMADSRSEYVLYVLEVSEVAGRDGVGTQSGVSPFYKRHYISSKQSFPMMHLKINNFKVLPCIPFEKGEKYLHPHKNRKKLHNSFGGGIVMIF